MRIIPTRFHGIDYFVGLLVLASPWLFGFAGSSVSLLHVLVGIVILAATAMTDFELGIARIIPMPVHLMLDALIGIVALVSPWLFDVREYVGLHIVLGLFEVGTAVMSSTRPAGRAIAA